MHYKLKYIFVCCCLTVLFSCQQTKKNYNISEIEVDITSEAELKLSDYFENFRLLKLSTDVVMGEIKRIRYENNQIYVSDGNTLFIFFRCRGFIG